jgi:hypothetical protein
MHDRGYQISMKGVKDKAEFDALIEDSYPAFYAVDKMLLEKFQNARNAPVSKLVQVYDSIFHTAKERYW